MERQRRPPAVNVCWRSQAHRRANVALRRGLTHGFAGRELLLIFAVCSADRWVDAAAAGRQRELAWTTIAARLRGRARRSRLRSSVVPSVGWKQSDCKLKTTPGQFLRGKNDRAQRRRALCRVRVRLPVARSATRVAIWAHGGRAEWVGSRLSPLHFIGATLLYLI
jgi:hypothetical protein